MFPHATENKAKGAPAGQSVVLDKIEVNVDVPDTAFAMPAPRPAPQAGAGEGD
jgi:hypothetical protein